MQGKAILGVALFAIIASACGDDVTTSRRTVYLDEEGNAVDNSGDAVSDEKKKKQGGGGGGGTTGDAPNNPPGTTLEGAIVAISALGIVQGWAIDKADTAEIVAVRFFIGGDKDNGTEVGVAEANRPGFDNSNDGDHRFEFAVPEQYRDGAEQSLVAYMEDVDQEGPISSSAKMFTAYAPTPEGEAYYANTVRPNLVNNCQGCHPNEVNYDNHYRLLLDKSPAQGGTATVNRLIQKANGQLEHGGGNRCGNINNGACGLLQEWWNREFGG